MPAPRRLKLAPREPRLGAPAQLLVAGEGVEQIELIRRAREPPLLELPGHRDQPVGYCGDVVPGRRTAPGISTRAAVGEHAARDDEPFLVLGAQLCEILEFVLEQPVGYIELRLDIGLVAVRSDESCVSARPEQETDRLREDRLTGARFARDRIQPGSELELGLAERRVAGRAANAARRT